MLHDPVWLAIAKKYIGLKEIKGPHHNKQILRFWRDIGAPFHDDETPWCGAFAGGVLREAGFPTPVNGASARSYLSLPTKLTKPAVGAIVIFWRGSKSGPNGHVGFVVGADRHGNIMVLGGNQGDAVSIKPFAITGPNARVLGYRWPGIFPVKERFNLPIIDSDGRLSENEA